MVLGSRPSRTSFVPCADPQRPYETRLWNSYKKVMRRAPVLPNSRGWCPKMASYCRFPSDAVSHWNTPSSGGSPTVLASSGPVALGGIPDP